MTDLDNKIEIKKFDPKDVYGSTSNFISQCKEIFEKIEMQKFTQSASGVKNIVFSGMGGSAYGGHVANALLKEDLAVPAYINSDYSIPNFVGEDTLFIATSYSGTTEETVSSTHAAARRGAKVVTLSSGGELSEIALKNNFDAVVFDPKSNPSGQPRLGTGYIVLGTIEILRKLGLTSYSPKDIEEAISQVASHKEEVEKESKSIAQEMFEYIPFIFAGDHLAGNAHIMRNQFNETAKNFSSYHTLPEADHHLLEGLSNPKDSKLVGFFLESDLYSDKLKKRFKLTREVVEKNNKKSFSYRMKGKGKLSQVLEGLMLGSYVTFYEAILYEQDPSLIPWVDYFKEQLAVEA